MNRLIAVFLSAAILFSACSNTVEKADDSAIIFTDSLSREVSITTANRVVAATGSLAEIWLLAGGTLVGTTDDAFDGRLEIPDEVQNIGKLHQLSAEVLIDLQPDLIIFSAEMSSQLKLREAVESAGIAAVYLTVESFGDYLSALEKFTKITGSADLYKENGVAVKEKIDEITAEVPAENSLKILLLRANSTKVEARSSSTLAGIILKDMGCENIADSDGVLENLSMEVIIKENPDYIFVILQGEDEAAARAVLEVTLTSSPAWANLSAVKDNRFVVLPKELFHQKPNVRWN